MIDIIKWLESPDGESWSRVMHNQNSSQRFLMMLKPDNEMHDDEELILWW